MLEDEQNETEAPMFIPGIPHKLSVASRHIETAILLTALRADVRSVHVLVMATDELIGAYGRKTATVLPMDIDGMIREDMRQEWFKAKNKAYNFFKHADRDPLADYDGPDEDKLTYLNDLMLVQAIINIRALGLDLSTTMKWFWRSALVLMPQIVMWDTMPGTFELIESMKVDGRFGRNEMMQMVLAAAISDDHLSASDFELANQLIPHMPELP